jgi:uncharacterized membrane protein YsdA (DUF1294 family)
MHGRSKRALFMRTVVLALFAGVVAAAVLVAVTALPPLWSWMLGFGLVTFLVYGYDKLRAKTGGWRVPELALLALTLLGGALGGWAGMLMWRHKTAHPVFWTVQAIGTIELVAALWLL